MELTIPGIPGIPRFIIVGVICWLRDSGGKSASEAILVKRGRQSKRVKMTHCHYYLKRRAAILLVAVFALHLYCSIAFTPLFARSTGRAYCRLATNTGLAASTSSISNVGVVLLAGGKGKRMKSNIPKQFLPLLGKPVFLRSLEAFSSLNEVVSCIVIVLDESFRKEYQHVVDADSRIRWADPGVERQDSVFSGLSQVPDDCSLVAIHDAARPLVTEKEIMACLADAKEHGAAVLGVPVKATIKESADGQFVLRTVERSRLWEIHTPQISSKALFLKGFAKVSAEKLEVTDDVSVVEALGLPVKITLGEYSNIKLTTPDDLQIAEQVLRERGINVAEE